MPNNDDEFKTFDPFDWYWMIGASTTEVYSSKKMAAVTIDDADFVAFANGKPPAYTAIDSMDSLIEVLRLYNVPPYHRVFKSTVISRLSDVQLASASDAFGQLSNMRLRERWYAPDQPSVNADDPDTLNFLAAIGADPKIVLAP